MLSSARCDADVLSEDWRAFVWRDVHQTHVNRAAMRNHRVTLRSLEVLHPIRDRAEHRDHVPLARHSWNNDGVLTHAAGYAVADS